MLAIFCLFLLKERALKTKSPCLKGAREVKGVQIVGRFENICVCTFLGFGKTNRLKKDQKEDHMQAEPSSLVIVETRRPVAGILSHVHFKVKI